MATEKQKRQQNIAFHVTGNELNVSEGLSRSYAQEFAHYVRALRQNWRQGTAYTKDRSEVNRTTQKPWRQKGTGRARAGTPRSPIWRGGGVIFGPHGRNKTLGVNKATRRNAMLALLHEKLQNGTIIALDVDIQAPKTAEAAKALRNAGLDKNTIALLSNFEDDTIHAAFANIPNVRLIFFDQPNAYELACTQYWVVLKKDLDQLKQMVSSWI